VSQRYSAGGSSDAACCGWCSGGDDGPGRLFLAEVVLELVVDAAFAQRADQQQRDTAETRLDTKYRSFRRRCCPPVGWLGTDSDTAKTEAERRALRHCTRHKMQVTRLFI